MYLERRHIIKFLHIQGLKLGEIAQKLPSAYRPDPYTSPSVNSCLHQIKLRRTDLRTQHPAGRPPLDDIGAEILSFLRKYPFSSVRTTAESLEIPVSIIDSHLVEKIGLQKSYFAGFPNVNQRVAAEVSRTLESITPGA
jgi:hypothetical protein